MSGYVAVVDLDGAPVESSLLERGARAQEFHRLCRLAARVPVRILTLPAALDRLDQVAAAIADDAQIRPAVLLD